MHIQPVSIHYQQPIFTSKKKVKGNTVTKTDTTPNRVAYPRRYLPQFYKIENARKTHDSFTKLRDKNYLLTVLDSKIQLSQKTHKGFSLAMFDMDNFKSINELLGYKTGDDFIKEIASCVSDVTQKNNLHAYRFGGDEFLVILDNKSKEKSEQISQEVVESISKNEYIRSNQERYLVNAYNRLNEYLLSNDKVKDLMPLKAERELLKTMQEHLITQEAKNDPYLKQTIETIDSKLKILYINLITESIAKEDDVPTQEWLVALNHKFENNEAVSEREIKELDEYLLSVFAKNYEIHQVKKWISDFKKNSGFSITGGIVEFTPEDLEGKSAIDIINDTGEILKNSKNKKRVKVHLG